MPKLKHPMLCRITLYVLFGILPLSPIFIIPMIMNTFPSIPDIVGIIIFLLVGAGYIYFLFANFFALFMSDIAFTSAYCYMTARRYFRLPSGFSEGKLNKRISRFGKGYEPNAMSPRPDILRYKSSSPVTIYSCGIERVIVTYRAELLTKALYHSIISSATANSKALAGKKKHLFLDKNQKKSPLNRATVVIIYAKDLDASLKGEAWRIVTKNGGDENVNSLLPCIIELREGRCTFDSLRYPYIGFGYPAKNRGINLIRNFIFGGKLPIEGEPDRDDAKPKDYDMEQSLWSFLKQTQSINKTVPDGGKKKFKKMAHGDVKEDDGWVYLKLHDKGICLPVDRDEETKNAVVALGDVWDLPKGHKVSKTSEAMIKDAVQKYYRAEGYTVSFESFYE